MRACKPWIILITHKDPTLQYHDQASRELTTSHVSMQICTCNKQHVTHCCPKTCDKTLSTYGVKEVYVWNLHLRSVDVSDSIVWPYTTPAGRSGCVEI